MPLNVMRGKMKPGGGRWYQLWLILSARLKDPYSATRSIHNPSRLAYVESMYFLPSQVHVAFIF
jgi:hypothetical protein